jgi:DNA mismatch repair protein MutS
MGGKSTIMRQAALLVILGQMGAPIPAEKARWGIFTSIHTRIGAHDAIAKGQSTFMVEMTELAAILRMADARSLIILDEIGRGTSTFDGMSVAWATLEWIQRQLRSRTLFATHYHELTELASTLPALANAHLAVEHSRTKSGVSLRFLYELRDGPSSESFGIHVAQLAGLPKPVVDRAWQVLENLEAKRPDDAVSTQQLSLFAPPPSQAPTEAEPHPVLSELERADVNAMTPLQALNFLARLRESAQKQSGASA